MSERKDSLLPAESERELTVPSPDTSIEKKSETIQELTTQAESQPSSQVVIDSEAQAPIHGSIPIKDSELLMIESIMEEGLSDIFVSMPAEEQHSFKKSGERAAASIREIIRKGVFSVRDIVSIIAKWLKTLPGINRFFLEQEAKIKADKIIDRFKHE